jgi:hypothetical protein
MAPKNKTQEVKQANAPAPVTDGPQQTALANVPISSGLATGAVPSWLAKHMEASKPRGLENVDTDDIIYPRLVLCQDLTKAVKDGLARPGDMIDNLTLETLCKDGDELHIIPIVLTKSRMYLVPLKDGGGISCRSDDSLQARLGGIGKDQGGEPTRNCADCVHKEWTDTEGAADGGRPLCTEFYNIVALLPQFDYRVIVWSLKATQVKVARRFLSVAKQTGVDFFALKFAVRAVEARTDAFEYKNFDFKGVGYVNEEEYARALRMYESLKGERWSVSVKDIEEQSDSDDSGTEHANTDFPTEPTALGVVEGQVTAPPPPPPASKQVVDVPKQAPKQATAKGGADIPW